MKKLEFKIEIAAGKQKVWETMLNPDTYKKWTNVSWPNSTYEGTWKQGEEIRFAAPGQGGTLAKLVECKPYDYILAKHIAVINADGTLDKDSDVAKGWIGTTEAYSFTEKNGKTELKVEMQTTPDWESMFSDGWPNALKALKQLAEGKTVKAEATH